jgi:molybdopterin synthase catalytic subunit/molybdopterin converting factor small subunit
MRITIRAFASYREAIGSPRLQLEFPDRTTPDHVWETLTGTYPKLRRLPRPSGFAINEEYVSGTRQLQSGDELALIPPVSGGSIMLVEGPIDVNAVLGEVRHPQAGATVLFLGTVRDNNHGRHVEHLEYEAYQQMALREMERVAEETRQRWPVLGISMYHRLGHLEVGEISVAIAVSAAHRKEAFEAGRFAIDTLKQTVPIWKKEIWEGGAVWIGSEAPQR